MKILILYFSGTGNTCFIAEKIRDELCRGNYDVQLSAVETFPPAKVDKFDVLILGYPVYACDMPLFLQDYVNELTLPRTQKAILFSTMGFYSANAFRKIGRRLIRKGMVPLHFAEVKMPGSDGLVFMGKESRYVMKVRSTNFNEAAMIKKAVAEIAGVVANLGGANGKRAEAKLPPVKWSGWIMGGLMSLIYKLVEKKMKRKFRADEQCIKCRLCERICPSRNIAVQEEVIFADRCFLCMRCINQCPTEAIQIGAKTQGKFRWKGPDGNYSPAKR
ncbi:flavodoxin signature [Lucifera butyrica]|uniref:Flavodoxin signature n=1 Tax=Lucifera butyrica TaxID=1351585 RepID=A0A498R8R4_9FIRM|nr:EFR1 family ferrodoxin [Lucifera butyrica]VBB07337.1 flavodoxin signature [Lucifera butyrica]